MKSQSVFRKKTYVTKMQIGPWKNSSKSVCDKIQNLSITKAQHVKSQDGLILHGIQNLCPRAFLLATSNEKIQFCWSMNEPWKISFIFTSWKSNSKGISLKGFSQNWFANFECQKPFSGHYLSIFRLFFDYLTIKKIVLHLANFGLGLAIYEH